MAANCTQNCSNIHSRKDHEDDIGPGFHLSTHLVIVVMGVFIVIFNGSVLYLMKTRRSLRTVTNYFLASLATSDLITGLYTVPVYIACSATHRDDLCQAIVPIFTFTSISTLSHIVVVTADRYIFIMNSLRYSAVVTKERGRVVMVVIWLFASLLALIQLVWARPGEVDVSEEGSDEFNRSEMIFSIIILAIVIAPFAWLIFAYGRIFHQIRRQNRFIRSHVAAGAERPRTHELRSVFVFFLMLVANLYCWLPNAIIRFQYSTSLFHLPEWAEVVIIHLRFLTSVINPLFFVFGKQDFRTSVDCCRLGRRLHVGGGESSSAPRSLCTGTTNELRVSVNMGMDSVSNSISNV